MTCPEDLSPLPEPLPAHSNLPGWLLLGFVIGVFVADALLWYFGLPTMSQWVKGKTSDTPWIGIGVAVLVGITLWHLLRGGPL